MNKEGTCLVLCWSTANRARDSISSEFWELWESWIPPSLVAIGAWSYWEQSPEDSRTVKMEKDMKNKERSDGIGNRKEEEQVALIRITIYYFRMKERRKALV